MLFKVVHTLMTYIHTYIHSGTAIISKPSGF